MRIVNSLSKVVIVKYRELYILSYVAYAISFIIPAYMGGSMSFCCGGTEIWFGWKCFIGVFAMFFMPNNFFLGLLLMMPNIYMILMLFLYKRVDSGFLLSMLLFNFLSCSYWWIRTINEGYIGDLLPGYWLWFLSILGNNIVLLLNKRKKA
jgi:hypothetical protein